MSKLFFNTRDDLVCIDSDLIAAVKADGNYTKVFYINGKLIHLNTGITKMEEILKAIPSKTNKFIRLGRSYIINHAFLFRIEPLKQQLILSDGNKYDLKVHMSKQVLKSYKEALEKRSEVIRQKKQRHTSNSDN